TFSLTDNQSTQDGTLKAGSTSADDEIMSPFDHLASDLQPIDMLLSCDSSSEVSFAENDTENEDLPEEDRFKQGGTEKDLDVMLMSAGTTTKAEALLMAKTLASKGVS
ncbi:hypothetical protein LDENG_00249250, partial [Lucifuga dentata]